MDVRQLRYFVAVARARNFTRAAAALHIAQPPLSRQIQQLEDELGTVLIDRDSRPIRLTEAGRFLFDQSVQILERLDEIKAMTRRVHQTGRTQLGVGFVPSVLYADLPGILRRLRAARPGVELSLLEMTTLEQVAALRHGRIDVGFGRILFDDPKVAQTRLREERLCVALPASHPLAAGRGRLRLADLVAEPLVIYPKTPRPSYADQVLALFRARDLRPATLLEVRELQTALGLVVAEAGLCIVPRSVRRLRQDSIVYRDLSDPDAVSPIIMSTRRDETAPGVADLPALIRALYQDPDTPFDP